MGARISITLNNLLHNENVDVVLYTEKLEGQHESDPDLLVQKAKVKFARTSIYWVFDSHIHEGRVYLEADFNYFRNPDVHSERMRLLFENSIPFNVIP